ncbi:MAG TPA: MauE/DoxX family redox-associated membrane protein [Solirubrobacteraceae bacterium]|nr:MauE/DoxX family redox-associated membrane protein [Solirubrobacteraceae bacterium]
MTWSQRLLAVVFTAAGALHFLRPAMYEEIMPDYVPAHHELVLASGAAEIAGALMVIFPRTRRLGGLWLAATLVAVFPANLNMALHPDRYASLAPALLWARLPLQALLIWWALRATRPASAPANPSGICTET